MRRWYLLALTLFLWIPSVEAGDIYVSDGEGDDVLHDGSAPTVQGGGVGPFKTIGKALQGAGAGDTVHLRTGTYLEAVFVTVTAAAATPLTIQNYNGEVVGINSGTTNPFLILNASGIVIDGVRVENKVGASSLLVSGSSDVVLRNMTVSGSASSDTGAAVTVIDSSSVTVEDCVFSDNLDLSLQLVNVGTYEVSGSDFSGSRATSTLSVAGTSGTGLIDDNDFVDNWGTGGGGFNVLSISQAAAGHTVSNNRLSSTVVPADVYDFANAISVFLTNGVALNGNSVTGFSFNATGGGFTGNGISINGVSGTPVDGASIATAGITGGGGLSLQLSFAQNTTVADLSSDQKAQVQSATNCAFVRPVFQNVTDGPTLFLNDSSGVTVSDGEFLDNAGTQLLFSNTSDSSVLTTELRRNRGATTISVSGTSTNVDVGSCVFEDNHPLPVSDHVVVDMSANGSGFDITGNDISNSLASMVIADGSSVCAVRVTNGDGYNVQGNTIGNFAYPFAGGVGSTGAGICLAGQPLDLITNIGISTNVMNGLGGAALTASHVDQMVITNSTFEFPVTVTAATASSLTASTVQSVVGDTALTLGNVDGMTIQGVNFVSNAQVALSVLGIQNSLIDSCTFTGNRGNSALLISGATTSAVTVLNCDFVDNHPQPMAAHNVINVQGTGTGVVLQGNSISNTTTGLALPLGESGVAISLSDIPSVALLNNTLSSFVYDKPGAPGTGGAGVVVKKSTPGLFDASLIGSNMISGLGGSSIEMENFENLVLASINFDSPVYLENGNAILINQCAFDGIGPSGVPALSLVGCDGVTLSNSTFQNSEGLAVFGENTSFLDIQSNQFTGNKGSSTILATGAGTSQLTINGNTFIDNCPDPLGSHSVIAVTGTGTGVTITNNSISNTTADLPLTGPATVNAVFVSDTPTLVYTGNSISSFSYLDGSVALGSGLVVRGTAGNLVQVSSFTGNTFGGVGGRALDQEFVDGLQLTGLTFTSPLNLRGMSNLVISNCTFSAIDKAGQPALELSGCTSPVVELCQFNDTVGIAMFTTETTGLLIDQNVFRRNRASVCLLVNGVTTANTTVSGNLFEDNHPAVGGDFAVVRITSEGAGLTMTGNVVTSSGSTVVVPPGTDVAALQVTAGSGINVADNVIQDFVFDQTDSSGTRGDALALQGSGPEPLGEVTVSNNTIQTIGGLGLRAGAIQQLDVSNSHFAYGVNLSTIADGSFVGSTIAGVARATALSLNESGSLLIDNVVFQGNSGDALAMTKVTDSVVSNCQFLGNRGTSSLVMSGSEITGITVADNVFTDNYPLPMESHSVVLIQNCGLGISLTGNVIGNATPPSDPMPVDGSVVAVAIDETLDVVVENNTVQDFSYPVVGGAPAKGTGIKIFNTSGTNYDGTLYGDNMVIRTGNKALEFHCVENLTLQGRVFDSPVFLEEVVSSTISACSFTGIDHGQSPALSMVRCNALVVSGCSFQDSANTAIFIHDSVGIDVDGNTFTGNHGDTTIAIEGPLSESVQIRNNTFVDNYPEPTGTHSVIAAVGTGSGIEITNNAISNTSIGIVVPDGASANAIFLDRVPGVVVSGNQISSYSFADSLKAVGTGIVLTGEPGQPVSASGVSGNPISGVGEKSYDLRYVSGFQLVGVTIDEPLKVRDSDAVLIQDCVFDSIGPSSLGPVLTLSGCDGATVEESVFTNNDGRSILANGASNLLIRNNLFDGNQGLACLTVSGAAATDVEILDNEFVDNFPLDLSTVPAAEKLLAVILVADAGAGIVIDGNTIWNRSVPAGIGSLANGQRASAISIGSTDGASVTDNVITSYRFSGFVDLTADFDPSFLITPTEGGQVGGGISLSAESGQSFDGGVVVGNVVSGCGSIGIAVGRGSNLSIASNSVSWCGAHGIQLSADIEKLGGVPVVPRSTPMTGSVIENNVTYENGWLHGGNSGIGLFYAGTDDGSPANIIRGNYSFRNRQGTYPNKGWDWFNDGNGIIMDTGSNGNLVYNNICADNEGAGLAIVKSTACQVFHNTAVGNGFLPSAEFSPDLESQPGITVTNLPPEPGFSSADNVVVNNLAYDSRNIQISIEGGSGQTLQNNLLAQGPNSLTGPFYDQLFQVTNQTGAAISGNLAATPVFDGDISQLGVNSFALATGSPGIAAGADLSLFAGVLPVTLDADYAGAARNATTPTIGAFEVVPTSEYEEWAAVAFAGSAVTETGPDDDPDGDGIVNLFEFAYRLNPLIADMFAPLELDGLPSAAPDAVELVVRLNEATLLTELQRTTDLGAWSSNELSFGLNGWVTGDPDLQIQTAEFLGDDLWKLRVVDSHGDPKVFYRMNVDLR